MKIIDRFHFTKRYPGDDNIELDKDDIESCYLAVTSCRAETLEFIKKQTMSFENVLADATDRAGKGTANPRDKDDYGMS